jgi:phage tail-like protein
MAKGEIVSTSRFYFEIDGMTDLMIKKFGGVKITLDAAGDKKAFGVGKGGKSQMQATVSGVTSGVLSIEFAATVDEKSLHDWYRDSHASVGPMSGGTLAKKGERKNATLTAYTQGGDEAARWTFSGVFPKSYKTSKMEPGSTELFTEKIEVAYETCHRVK